VRDDAWFGEAIFHDGAGFAQATFQRKALFFGATFRGPGPPRYSAPGLASTRLLTTLPTSSADRIKTPIAAQRRPGRRQLVRPEAIPSRQRLGRDGAKSQSWREPD
jgi:hypothetical protein